MTTTLTPAEAWAKVVDGNRRFADGISTNPGRDPEYRRDLTEGQSPHTTVLGCSDSRVPMEVIFDAGLGDLFVVRNAGQVAGSATIASLEYAVGVLNVPLIVVLSHMSCGAVSAAIASTAPGSAALPPLIAAHIAPVVTSAYEIMATTGANAATVSQDDVGAAHLRTTVARILEKSELIAQSVAEGKVAIVAADYRLDRGLVVPHFSVGAGVDAA